MCDKNGMKQAACRVVSGVGRQYTGLIGASAWSPDWEEVSIVAESSGRNRTITPEAAYRALKDHPNWVVERARLYRDFRFDSFVAAIAFINGVAGLAERLGHHPNIRLHEWCFVQLELYSHLDGALSVKDVDFAVALDAMLAAEGVP